MKTIEVKKKKITVKLNAQKIYPALEDLKITPSSIEQNFKSNLYGYNNVKVEAVSSDVLDVTPTEETQQFVGLYGIVNVDKIETEEKTESIDFSNGDVFEITPSENTYLKKVTINKDEDLIAENIKSGTNIYGVVGTGKITDVLINDARYLFYQGYRTDEISGVCSLINPNCTDFAFIFANCSNLTTIPLINTSNVESFSYMFNQCQKLTSIPQLDTSSGTNFGSMFSGCTSLTTVPQLDTSSGTNFHSMFSNTGLTTSPQLDTSNGTNFQYIFRTCKKLIEIPQLDTSNGTNLSYMFESCSSLTTVPQIDCVKATTIAGTFSGCSNLTNFGGFKDIGNTLKTTTSANNSNYTLSLTSCPLVTHDSLMNVINGVYDIAAKGFRVQSIKIGETNLAKLTAEEIAIATNKGWSVS